MLWKFLDTKMSFVDVKSQVVIRLGFISAEMTRKLSLLVHETYVYL